VVRELVDEVVLARQDDGHDGFGIHVELSNGVQQGKRIESQEVGLVDDEDGGLFQGGDFQQGGSGKSLGDVVCAKSNDLFLTMR